MAQDAGDDQPDPRNRDQCTFPNGPLTDAGTGHGDGDASDDDDNSGNNESKH